MNNVYEPIRKLAINPKKTKNYFPIEHEGKTYWCLEELKKETRKETIYEMLIAGIIGMAIIIVSIYGAAMLIPIN